MTIRCKLFCLMAIVALTAMAQTRQGVVRTPQRPSAASVKISEAVIALKGGTTVRSRSNGVFSVTKKAGMGNTFQVNNVTKQGYELFDRKVIGKSFDFGSKEVMEIVLVDIKQQQRERLQLEKKAEERAYATYRKKLDRLTKQYEQDKALTEEQYRKQLQELQEALERYTKNISTAVDYYLHIDYLGMDEKDAEIARCMENAEYERADSLIRMVFDPTSVVTQSQAASAEIDDEEAALMTQLDALKQKRAQKKAQDEKNAEYLHYLYTIALSNFNNDSAAIYITARASLDTTNIEWQNDAGNFFKDYLQQFDKAEKHFIRNINTHLLQGEAGELGLADDYENLAHVYYTGSHFQKDIDRQQAIPLIKKTLAIREKLLGENDPLTAEAYNNLGLLLNDADLVYQAIKILETQPGEKNPNLATYYENFAALRLIPDGYWRQAMEHYLLPALEIKEKAYGKESLEVAENYNRIGQLYIKQSHYFMSHGWDDCAHALSYIQKALQIFERTYGHNHLRVAEAYLQLGGVLSDMAKRNNIFGNVALANGYLILAKEDLTEAQNIYQTNKEKYGIERAESSHVNKLLKEVDKLQKELGEMVNNPGNRALSCKDLAALNYSHKNYESSLKYLQQAMRQEYSYERSSYDLALEYLDMGKVYYTMDDTTKAQQWFDKALAASQSTTTYKILLELYDSHGESLKAADYCRKLIELERAEGAVWPEQYERMATIYEHAEDYAQAIKYWQQALEIRNSDYHTPPAENSLINILLSESANSSEQEFYIPSHYDNLVECYNKLGKAFTNNGDKSNAEKCFNTALTMQTDSLGEEHELVAACYDRLGMMYCHFGEYDQARIMLDKSLQIREKAEYNNGVSHDLAIANSDICYGKYYAAQADSTQALKYFRHAYSIRKDALGLSASVAECWLCVAKVCEDFGRLEDALDCYYEAINIILEADDGYTEWAVWKETAINPPKYETFSLMQHIKELEAKCLPIETNE